MNLNWRKIFIHEKGEVIFPASLRTDLSGFSFFAQLLRETRRVGDFVFNFTNVEWIEANLCAILGAIIKENQKYGAKFEFIKMNHPYLERTLTNNGFINIIKQPKIHLGSNSSHSGIPYKSFDMANENDVESYIYDFVLLSREVPKMSSGAKKKIYRSIFEIYQNSVLHSGADELYVCGQFYRGKKRMALTMVEIGRTFKDNVTSCKEEYALFTGVECLKWAVVSGNTTKPKTETGGLGIDLIREFLKMNGGKIQIRSADGYWEEKKGITFAYDCLHDFQGSIVNIEFNLFDENEYTTEEELVIKDIL